MPAMVRWPGLVPPHVEINDIFSAEDWMTTLVAAAGEPDIKNKLLQGYDAAGKNFRVHLDGYDQRDLLAGKGSRQAQGILLLDRRRQPRRSSLPAVESCLYGAASAWLRCLGTTDGPAAFASLFNLRSDPFERAQHEAGDYVRWFVEHAFVLVPAQALVGQHLMSFKDFPPRQEPGSFSVEQAMEKLRNPPSSN